PSFSARLTTNLSDFPWWALIIFAAGLLLVFNFATDETYNEIIRFVAVGVRLTIIVTLSAYSIAIVLGLLTALGQLSQNIFARNAALLYVQIVRGIPILVQIFIWALVLVPLGVGVVNNIGNTLAGIGLLSTENILSGLIVRDISFIMRGIIALAISYGAFSSEIFRAGIQSIERGQVEAAESLGLTRFQSLRLIILPQAVRRVLPPLGNDFIAMLKESSLLSVIGVAEITQLGKKYAAASFVFPQTYYSIAFLYLSMTLLLSAGVKYMERRLKSG
ncbi:MAG: amino acid ABC transporter permease, partial [Chloroflexi bacterium]|nr:amino acid ABC transporter permease [Chloroflexota bacterium]